MISSSQTTRSFFGNDSPEAELLLCCARTSVDSHQIELIKSLTQNPLNWHSMWSLAAKHGVLTLLYWNLKSVCPELVPAPELHKLGKYFQINSLRNKFLEKELVKLLHLFKTHEISAVPFKGPVLASTAYGNLSLRSFGDLDILVQKRDLDRAYQVLRSQDYKRKSELDHEQETDPGHSKYHTFVRGNGLVHVDLQWIIAGPHFSFSLDHHHWWERLHVVSLNGSMVPSLPPEETLLILCVHGSKHLWEKLKWICDVAELVRVHGLTMDWSRVIEEAQRLGCQRMLFLGLSLARDLLGTHLSEQVLPLIKKGAPRLNTLAVQVYNGLFPETGTHINSATDISLWYLSMRDRWQDRMRYYFHLCISRNLSTTDWAFLPHPILYRLFYYISQPLRLVGKYGLPFPKMKHRLSSWLERMG